MFRCRWAVNVQQILLWA